MSADDRYEPDNDASAEDAPSGNVKDNSHVSRTGQRHVPVVKDDAEIEDPIDPATADSDQTLGTVIMPPFSSIHPERSWK